MLGKGANILCPSVEKNENPSHRKVDIAFGVNKSHQFYLRFMVGLETKLISKWLAGLYLNTHSALLAEITIKNIYLPCTLRETCIIKTSHHNAATISKCAYVHVA